PVVDRQRERERRALPQVALHPDPAAMQLDELAGESQPEPGTPDLLVWRPDLPELLEDRLLVLSRDADAGVGDGDLDRVLVHHRGDVDPAARGRELPSIGQEVQEQLLDLALVAADRSHRAVDRALEGDPSPDGALADESEGVIDSSRQIELRQL